MYIPQSIQQEEDYQACIRFHGHLCWGVTIGYLAAKLGMQLLSQERSEDEEMITIVENDACCCDAIQVLTGCTFGKGNFFFKDHGKMAFTFGSRISGKAYRLLLNNEVLQAPPAEQEMADRIAAGSATAEEKRCYEEMYEQRGRALFAQGYQVFFKIQELDLTLPPTAERGASTPCGNCGEVVLASKLVTVGTTRLCRACVQN